jgi:Fe-S-cluster-containing hydrogenase component 2
MIRVDLSRCTGCRSCEAACSFFHTGAVLRDVARIRVTHLYALGVDGPVTCVQCKERYCLSCSEKALRIGPGGQVIASPSLCTACKKCAKACPIGAVEVHRGVAHVCDLCGGAPRCVEACTEGALFYNEGGAETVSLEAVARGAKRLNPSEKRRRFVAEKGEILRRSWRGGGDG